MTTDDIGLELIDSGFEYFAGGGLLKPTGAEGDQADLYALAEKAGYHVVKTQAEAEQVTGGPVVIIDEHLADSDAMAYEIGPHRRHVGPWPTTWKRELRCSPRTRTASL